MGGHISVGVRRKDGTFETMGVWTNPLRYFVQDERFLNGSLDPLDEFFARYRKDGVDFGGPQQHEPGEYGYVLVDEIERTVHNCNGYTALGSMSVFDLDVRFGVEEIEVGMREQSVESRRLIRKYGSRIRKFARMEGQEVWTVVDMPKVEDDDALVRYLVTHAVDRRLPYMYIDIEFPSWTVVDLHDDLQGFLAVKAALERCVKLTEAEEKEWQDRIRDFSGEDDDLAREDG